MAMLSYPERIPTIQSRAIYMTVAEDATLVGSLIGTLVNGPVINNYGLDTLTYLTAGISLLPGTIALVFFTDIMHADSACSSWRDVVGWSHLTNVFGTVYRRRQGHKPLMLNMSFGMYSLPIDTVSCSIAGSFIFVVKQLGFTMNIIFSICQMLCRTFASFSG